jgi:hypothetical protein
MVGAGREMTSSADFDPTQPEVRGAMQVYENLVGVVHAAGARLLVVYVPLAYAIQPRDKNRWSGLENLDVSRLMAFQAAFVRYLNDCKIPSIDITQQLQKSAESGTRIYFWLDIHWTPAGNAAAARAVADYLR